MDKLDHLIADFEAKIAEIDAQLGMLGRERDRASTALAAYREAAEIRPPINSALPEDMQDAMLDRDLEVKARGRQPGSIASDWRSLMRHLVAEGRPWLTYGGIQTRCNDVGIDIMPASIRGRVRQYTDLGFFEELDGRFRVTDMAIMRFQLDAPVSRLKGIEAAGASSSA